MRRALLMLTVLSAGCVSTMYTHPTKNSSDFDRDKYLCQQDAARERIAELQGTIAELTAELDNARQRVIDVETENTQRRQKRARNDKLRGTTYKKETPLGVMFVTINEDDKGQPFEVFVTLGKAGGSAMADAEAMGRLISLALRSGIPLQSIHKQLRGISSDRARRTRPEQGAERAGRHRYRTG